MKKISRRSFMAAAAVSVAALALTACGGSASSAASSVASSAASSEAVSSAAERLRWFLFQRGFLCGKLCCRFF